MSLSRSLVKGPDHVQVTVVPELKSTISVVNKGHKTFVLADTNQSTDDVRPFTGKAAEVLLAICNRLAYCIPRYERRCIIPYYSLREQERKDFTLKQRLYLMTVGTFKRTKSFLSVKQDKKFYSLDEHSWRLIEDLWRCWGHLILVAPGLKDYGDPKLIENVLKFKRRFLLDCLRQFTYSPEHKRYVSKAGLFGLIQWMKTISSWAQEVLLYGKVVTPINSCNYGSYTTHHLHGAYPIFTMFGGHLKYLRDLFKPRKHDSEFKDTNYLHYLGMIRTFGRSLPCSNGFQTLIDSLETINILSKEYKYHVNDIPLITNLVEDAVSDLLFTKNSSSTQPNSQIIGDDTRLIDISSLNWVDNEEPIPSESHISVVTAATTDYSRTIGGQLTESKAVVKVLKNLFTFDPFEHSNFQKYENSLEFTTLDFADNPMYLVHPARQLFDDRNRVLYDAFGFSVTSTHALVREFTTSLLDKVYIDLDSEYEWNKLIDIYNLAEFEPLKARIGNVFLMVSTGMIWDYGDYSLNPDVIITYHHTDKTQKINIDKIIRIPLWFSSIPKIFTPSDIARIPSRLVASQTGGFKTRVVTTNPWEVGILMKYTKFAVRYMMSHLRPIRDGHKVSPLWAWCSFVNRTTNIDLYESFYSSDLRNATDYIPCELVKLIWTSFLNQFKMKFGLHPMLSFINLTWMKRYILVDNSLLKLAREFSYTIPNSFNQERGSLMGDPMSFMTLNLINYMVHKECNRTNAERLSVDPNLLYTPSLILGDDYLSLLVKEEDSLHLDALYQSLGLVLSKKHGVSPIYGIFAETMCLRNKSKVVFLDCLKLRLLNSIPATWQSEHRAAVLGKASQLCKNLDWLPIKTLKVVVPVLFLDLFHREYKHQMTFMDRFLPLDLPVHLGGLDFPGSYKTSKKVLFWVDTFLRSERSPLEKYTFLSSLARLNSAHRKGFSIDTDRILQSLQKLFVTKMGKLVKKIVPLTICLDGLPKELKPEYFYNDNQVQYYLQENFKISLPYPEPSFLLDMDNRDRLLQKYRIFSINRIVDWIERKLTFNAALMTGISPQEKTLIRYVNMSKKKWKLFNREFGPPPDDYSPDRTAIDKMVRTFNTLYVYNVHQIDFRLNGPSMVIIHDDLKTRNRSSKYIRLINSDDFIGPVFCPFANHRTDSEVDKPYLQPIQEFSWGSLPSNNRK